MEDINKVFTIQWVGPFNTFEAYKKYLNSEDTCQSNLFSFYCISGCKKGRGFSKDRIYRYFGAHFADSPINKRVNCSHEHLKHFREPFSLWLGSLSDYNKQNPTNVNDIETVFISTYKDYFSENRKKKLSILKDSICIINLWYKQNESRRINKMSDISFIDDVIVYEKEENTFSIGNLSVKK